MDTLGSVVDAVRAYKSLSLVAVASVSVYALVAYLRSPLRKLPPGPMGLPLLGNALQFTSGNQWTTFTDLRKKFGTASMVFISIYPYLTNTR